MSVFNITAQGMGHSSLVSGIFVKISEHIVSYSQTRYGNAYHKTKTNRGMSEYFQAWLLN